MDAVRLLSAAFDAALFHRTAFLEIAAAGVGAYAALAIPLLAGMSELAGQSVVLVARRANGIQALATFGVTGLIHIGAVAVWTFAVIALLYLQHVHVASIAGIIGVISLGYAPRALGVLTIAPYYGDLLGRVLDAWSMACVGWGLWITTGASLLTATICALLGWAVSHLIRRFGGRISAPALAQLEEAEPGITHA